uniref:Uncharacterized protein n=1 Tax=Trichogramma kaykai TaxID=54128 RepID=A0ABD2VY60_9HYME
MAVTNVELALSYSCDDELYINAKGFMIAQRTATSGSLRTNGKKGKKNNVERGAQSQSSAKHTYMCIVHTYNPQQGQESDYYRYIQRADKKGKTAIGRASKFSSKSYNGTIKIFHYLRRASDSYAI